MNCCPPRRHTVDQLPTIDFVIDGKPLSAPQFVVDMVDRAGGRSQLVRNLWACAAALVPLVRGAGPADPAELAGRPLWRLLAALAGGSLGATILLWIADAFGVELNGLLGLLVGGYLVVWFGAAGILSKSGILWAWAWVSTVAPIQRFIGPAVPK